MTNRLETTDATWSAADENFFRITAELFSTDFVRGAGAMLASYDTETPGAQQRVHGGASHTLRFVRASV